MADLIHKNMQWSLSGETPENTVFLEGADSIFLTGATGLLGSYILSTLLKKFPKIHIYCLVRASNEMTGFQRITETLSNYNLSSKDLNKRITALPGDLLQEKFGFSDTLYDQLAAKIDIIFHSGATINWVGSFESLQDINVGGTCKILEFSQHLKIKTLQYISTTAIYYSLDIVKHGYLNKNIELKNYCHHIIGYFKSKTMAEQFVQDAFKNGLPGNIIRPSFISGTQQSGYLPENDLTRLFVMACFECNAIPDSDMFFDILPTDVLAAAIVNIANLQKAPTRIYNLSNPAGISLKELGEFVQKLGFEIDVISQSDWQLRLKQGQSSPAKHILRKLTRSMPGAEEGFLSFLARAKVFEKDIDTVAALQGSGVPCPVIDNHYLLPFLSNIILTTQMAAE